MASPFVLFLFAAIALIIAPGQDTVYVITRAIAQGKVAGMISAMGVSSGIVIHTLFAAMGLSIILQSSAIAFTVIKYTGAAYLIYLGIKTFRNRAAFSLNLGQRQVDRSALFWQGFLSNVLNPKVALFFLAFLPQFVNPELGNSSFQMIGLGLVFTVMTMTWLNIIGYFAGSMGSWLARNTTALSILRWLTGSVFIGLGLRLAIPEHP